MITPTHSPWQPIVSATSVISPVINGGPMFLKGKVEAGRANFYWASFKDWITWRNKPRERISELFISDWGIFQGDAKIRIWRKGTCLRILCRSTFKLNWLRIKNKLRYWFCWMALMSITKSPSYLIIFHLFRSKTMWKFLWRAEKIMPLERTTKGFSV